MVNDRILTLLNEIAILFPVFLLIFAVKGFVQAFVAKFMGDKTAQEYGFLTLNPLAHIDLLGLIVVLIVYFVVGTIFTEPLPSNTFFIILVTFGARMIIPIPMDDHNFKHRTLGGICTALSGAMGNFLLAIGCILSIKTLLFFHIPKYALISLIGILTKTIDLCVLFGILNLIPIPPFDNGQILHYILPTSKQNIITWLEEYSFIIFLIIFFVPGISDSFFAILSLLSMAVKKILFSILIS